MERNPMRLWLQTLCALCLGVLLCLGGIGCVMTGFDLPGNWLDAWKFCLVSAAVMALCFHWKHSGWLLLPMAAGLAWYLMHRSGWLTQLESLLFAVSSRFDVAYGWGVVSWSDNMLAGRPVLPTLQLIGLLPCLAVIWTVQRCRRVWVAGLLSFLPLAVCLVVTDTVPEPLPLTIVLLGLGLLLLTQGARRQNPWEGCKLTVFMLLPSVLLLLAMTVAMPRENFSQGELALRTQEKIVAWIAKLPFVYQTEDRKLVIDLDGDGLEDKLDLSAIGPKQELRYQVMEVTADTGGELYLRGQTLGRYTGTGWETQDTGFATVFSPGEQEVAYALPPSNQEDLGEVTIHTAQAKDVLYSAYHLTGGEWTEYLEGDAYLRNPKKLKTYTFQRSRRHSGTETNLPEEEADRMKRYWHFAEEQYLELPEETERWAMEYLLKRVFADDELHYTYRLESIRNYREYGLIDISASEVMSIVGPIRKWLQSAAVYDLNTPRMPQDRQDFARWFLEESDTGYCTHFATAAVVLLRAAGIPARYASGYMVDVKAGVTTAVTSDMAHAWAEYFLPGAGWVVLDATPAAEQEGTDDPSATESKETTEPRRPATEPTEPRQNPQSPEESQNGDASRWEQARKVLQKLGKVVFWLAAIWYQSRLRLWLRKRWLARGSEGRRILRWWRYVGYLSRLQRATPPERLRSLAQEARFSNHAMTEAQIGEFDHFYREICREFRQQTPVKRVIWRLAFAVW